MANNRAETRVELLFSDGDFWLFRMAVNRALRHETEDFETETIENWPKIYFAVWNDPHRQLIAVQHRPPAFKDTSAPIALLAKSLAPFLDAVQLRISIEKVQEIQRFWEMIRRHQGNIGALRFELVTPNMANISGDLADDLKDFAKRTNAVESDLELKADDSASLKISESDPEISKLLQYSADGGGNVSIRLKGSKKKVSTSGAKEVTITELDATGPAASVALALKTLLSQMP